MKRGTKVIVNKPNGEFLHTGTVVDITTAFVKVWNPRKEASAYPDTSQVNSEWHPIEWCEVIGFDDKLKLEPVLL